MNRLTGSVFLGVMVYASMTVPGRAADVCVADNAQLAVALIQANLAPTTIKLVQGAYSLNDTLWHDNFVAVIQGGSSLRGGYTANCAGRDIAAENTTITDSPDSWDLIGVLGDLTLEGLSWHTSIELYANENTPEIASNSTILLRRNVFEGAQNGGILIFLAQDEELAVRIVDTLIHDSYGNASSAECALDVYARVGSLHVELINNTVVSNVSGVGGACFTTEEDGTGVLSAYNNVFYGNSGSDLVSNNSALVLVDNVIGTHSYPTPVVPPAGTLTGNPQLDGNYRPIEPGSPVINSGTEDAPGGLPSTDLDGGPRVIGSTVDRGAYESNINDAFVQSVTNTNDSGVGSLREAILNANANSSFNLIGFDIGGGCGPHVITLDSPLPSITGSMFVNGYSQPGSVQNDQDIGDDAVICVILKSGDASASTAFRVGSSVSNSVHVNVAGMAFSGFGYAAFDLKGGSEHVVSGNHFGGSVGGVGLIANQTNVWVGTGVYGVTIGGDDNGQRNIISGALGDGIHLAVPSATDLGAHNNQILNNYIGTTHSGDAAFGNGNGIYIAGDHNTLQHNLISGNIVDGVHLDGEGAHDNTLDTNVIGGADFGNGSMGVRFDNDASDNLIVSNTIANNAQKGVRIVTGVHNRISKNSIFSNGLLGIDLAGEGVTENDDDGAVMPDDYANHGLNFPVLTQAAGGAQSGVVSGTLTTVPGTYAVQLFVSGSCDGLGNGEGTIWRRTFHVTVPEPPFGTQGTVTFTTAIGRGTATTLLGKLITATATSTAGDTSEFSSCLSYSDDRIFADGFDPAT